MKRYVIFAALAMAGFTMAENEQQVFADGLFRRGMYATAATEYEALLKNDSAQVDARFRLAECYERMGELSKARAQYESVAAQTSGDRRISAQLRLAILFMEEGKPAEAKPLLEILLTAKCSDELKDATFYRLGLCYEALGRSSDAITLYKNLVQKGGAYAQYGQLALAEIALKQNRPVEALERYQAALQMVTNVPRQQEIAAAAFRAAYAAKDLTQATSLAQMIGEKGLGKANLLLPAAWVAIQAGRPEDARSWLAAEKLLRPKTSAERLMLEGTIASALGDTAGAIVAYERILSEFETSSYTKTAAERMLVLRFKQDNPVAFLTAFNRVFKWLDDEALKTYMPLRLDAALKAKDIPHAKAAATWLMEHAEAEQAADAAYRLAWMEQQAEQWEAAGEGWVRTAETWPTASCAGRAAYAAAYAFRQAKLPDREAHALRLALASGDNEVLPKAMMMKARGELAERDTTSAASTLDEFLTRFPTAPLAAEAAYLRGLIFFNLQDYKAAEERLDVALKLHEQHPSVTPLDHARRTDASMRRAQCLHALKRGDEAATLLQPLVALKDAQALNATYLRWLTEFRLERHEWAEAEATARALTLRADITDADRVLAQLLLGRAAEGQSQKATAMAAYDAALTMTQIPTAYDAEIAVRLGTLREEEGNVAKAREAFARAVESADLTSEQGRTLRAQAYAGIARTCAALGLTKDALRANMSLIIFFEDDTLVPEAYRSAIALLEAEGRTDEASTLRQEFQNRYPEGKK